MVKNIEQKWLKKQSKSGPKNEEKSIEKAARIMVEKFNKKKSPEKMCEMDKTVIEETRKRKVTEKMRHEKLFEFDKFLSTCSPQNKLFLFSPKIIFPF